MKFQTPKPMPNTQMAATTHTPLTANCQRHSYFDVNFGVNDAIMSRSFRVESVFTCILTSTNENLDTQIVTRMKLPCYAEKICLEVEK